MIYDPGLGLFDSWTGLGVGESGGATPRFGVVGGGLDWAGLGWAGMGWDGFMVLPRIRADQIRIRIR